MEIEITVYKESGKYYTGTIAKCDIDIAMFKDEFKKFVKDNLPADIGEGYVVVEDAKLNQSFHVRLYKYDEIVF